MEDKKFSMRPADAKDGVYYPEGLPPGKNKEIENYNSLAHSLASVYSGVFRYPLRILEYGDIWVANDATPSNWMVGGEPAFYESILLTDYGIYNVQGLGRNGFGIGETGDKEAVAVAKSVEDLMPHILESFRKPTPDDRLKINHERAITDAEQGDKTISLIRFHTNDKSLMDDLKHRLTVLQGLSDKRKDSAAHARLDDPSRVLHTLIEGR